MRVVTTGTKEGNKNIFGHLMWQLIGQQTERLLLEFPQIPLLEVNQIFKSILKATYDKYRISKHNEIYQDYVNELREVILKQKYAWTPLSKNYLKWKQKHGYDTRIYIQKGEFLKSIGIFRDGNTLYIGVDENKVHHSGLTYGQLWRILEFGTNKIPPRPLFRPTALNVMEKYRGNMNFKFRLSKLKLILDFVEI